MANKGLEDAGFGSRWELFCWVVVATTVFASVSMGTFKDPENFGKWIELLTGNGWPDRWEPMYSSRCLLFSTFVGLSTTAYLLPIFFAVWLVRLVFKVRNEASMNVLDTLEMRDAYTVNAIVRALNLGENARMKQQLVEAMNAAKQHWERTQLPKILGPKTAADFLTHEIALPEEAARK